LFDVIDDVALDPLPTDVQDALDRTVVTTYRVASEVASAMIVLVLSSRDLEKASTKYRIAQFRSLLQAEGVELEFLRGSEVTRRVVKTFGRYDLVFNQRCLFGRPLARRILDASRRTLFDFDDAIYTRSGKPYSWFVDLRIRRRMAFWLSRADVVTTANDYLAGYARRFGEHVDVIPMSVDLEKWKPPTCREANHVTIGWAGAPVNLRNLERLDGVLTRVLKRHPKARLAVFSGQRPRLTCPFDYVPFRPGDEPAFARRLDIGLLPIPYDEFTRGKSPIKAIQYLACSVPVVGNVIGATAEILNDTNCVRVSTEEDWERALGRLIDDPAARQRLGENGRRWVAERHDLRKTAQRLLQVFASEARPFRQAAAA
jgi:glycosyltransferase involved in cell wall biosynthesis